VTDPVPYGTQIVFRNASELEVGNLNVDGALTSGRTGQ
jgi:hypothetical protein